MRRPVREHANPPVHVGPVGEPVVDHERDSRKAEAAHALEHGQRHPAHGPPANDVRPHLAELAIEQPGVVALEPYAFHPRQAGEPVVAPVPDQVAADVRIVGLGRPDVEVCGENAHRVPVTFEMPHRWSPSYVAGFALLLGVCLLFLYGAPSSPFLYFQF